MTRRYPMKHTKKYLRELKQQMVENSQRKCYVYVYLDPRKPGRFQYERTSFKYEPLYVGKGTGGRVYDHISNDCRNPIFKRKINRIRKLGLEPILKMQSVRLTEREAHKLEVKLISKIGRINRKTGPLCNLTDGGEGLLGYIPTKETLELRKQNRSKLSPEELADILAEKARKMAETKARNEANMSPKELRKRKEKYKNGPKVRVANEAKMSPEELALKRAEKGRKISETKARNDALLTPEQKSERTARRLKTNADKDSLLTPKQKNQRRVARGIKIVEGRAKKDALLTPEQLREKRAKHGKILSPKEQDEKTKRILATRAKNLALLTPKQLRRKSAETAKKIWDTRRANAISSKS
jgi:hypothetical protein